MSDIVVPHRLGGFEAEIVVPEIVPGCIRLRNHSLKVAHTILGDELDFWLSDIERDYMAEPYRIEASQTTSIRGAIIAVGITTGLHVTESLRELAEHRVDQALRGTSLAMKRLLQRRQRSGGRLREKDVYRVINMSQRLLEQRPNVTVAVLG